LTKSRKINQLFGAFGNVGGHTVTQIVIADSTPCTKLCNSTSSKSNSLGLLAEQHLLFWLYAWPFK